MAAALLKSRFQVQTRDECPRLLYLKVRGMFPGCARCDWRGTGPDFVLHSGKPFLPQSSEISWSFS